MLEKPAVVVVGVSHLLTHTWSFSRQAWGGRLDPEGLPEYRQWVLGALPPSLLVIGL